MSDIIILHQFDASPFAEKVRLIFGLKRLAWKAVDAEMFMPKPNLTALTGGYRKTPVMQIGADVYCDSRLIAVKLEELHPMPTLFPGGNRGIAAALSCWSDQNFHIASSGSVIGANKHLFPPDLMKDRKEYFGTFMDVDRLDTDLPHLSAQLRSHADLVEQQLEDGRPFLLGDAPSLADFHAYVEIWTARRHLLYAEKLFEPFPKMTEWEQRVSAIGHGRRRTLDIKAAHSIAHGSDPTVGKGLDPLDTLKLHIGDTVDVTSDDYGSVPVSGKLCTLDIHEVAVEREDPIVGKVVVHFPRIGYRVESTERRCVPDKSSPSEK